MVMIVKSDGTREAFDRRKLERSLTRAGALPDVVQSVADEVESNLVDGMSTHELYTQAFALLRKRGTTRVSARYSLKKALFGFGPTGFPFERFLGHVFEALGHTVDIQCVRDGKCVDHEIDIVACTAGSCAAIEAKFHNTPKVKTDVVDALYVQARVVDLTLGAAPGVGAATISRGCLITNTKFTNKAIQYGECVDIDLISWSYPKEGNLHDLITRAGVHPVTCLPSLSHAQKAQLLKAGVVRCQDVGVHSEALAAIGLSPGARERVRLEAAELCTPAYEDASAHAGRA